MQIGGISKKRTAKPAKQDHQDGGKDKIIYKKFSRKHCEKTQRVVGGCL